MNEQPDTSASFDPETDERLQAAIHVLSAALLDCVPKDIKGFTCTSILGDRGAVHYRLEAENYPSEQASAFIDESVHEAACAVIELIKSAYPACSGFQIRLLADEEDKWKTSFDFMLGQLARSPRVENPLQDGKVQEIIDLISQVVRRDIMPPGWQQAFLRISLEEGSEGPGLKYSLSNTLNAIEQTHQQEATVSIEEQNKISPETLEVNETVHKLTCVLVARWDELGHAFPPRVCLELNVLPDDRMEINFNVLKNAR